MNRNENENHLLQQAKGKPYKILENYEGDLKGGTEAREYPDGSIRNERGHMLEPLPGVQTISTSERGRELSLARWEQSREAAIKGMIKGVQESGIKLTNASGDEAWTEIIRHTVKTYLKSSNIRGMGETLTKIGIATGYLDTKTEPPKQVNNTVVFSDTASKLLKMLQEEVIDAEIE